MKHIWRTLSGELRKGFFNAPLFSNALDIYKYYVLTAPKDALRFFDINQVLYTERDQRGIDSDFHLPLQVEEPSQSVDFWAAVQTARDVIDPISNAMDFLIEHFNKYL